MANYKKKGKEYMRKIGKNGNAKMRDKYAKKLAVWGYMGAQARWGKKVIHS